MEVWFLYKLFYIHLKHGYGTPIIRVRHSLGLFFKLKSNYDNLFTAQSIIMSIRKMESCAYKILYIEFTID